MTSRRVVTTTKSVVTDFGTRAISNQNFSKMIAIPKIALKNCGADKRVNVSLVQSGNERYIKLTPANGGK
jgi:hypothetical protein